MPRILLCYNSQKRIIEIQIKRKSMKKITLLASGIAMLLGSSYATAQEVTYVEDPAQGYLFNRFKDNWFIEAEGGAGVMMSKYDQEAKLKDRIGLKANLNVGKWFSPIWGARIGGEFNEMKGATYRGTLNSSVIGAYTDKPEIKEGYYKQKFNNVGVGGDLLLNVTNWWLGYRPNRFYNAIVYAGASIHWVFERDEEVKFTKWTNDYPARNLSLRAGLLNTFRLSNHVNLMLDLRWDQLQEHVDGWGQRTWNEYPSVLLGLQYKFNKTDWNAPIVPVCPTYQHTDADYDALMQKYNDAQNRINELEDQLEDCRKQPKQVVEAPKQNMRLATVYFPINKYYITKSQQLVVNAVADQLQTEEGKKHQYLLTGWADNYTGNDRINVNLRKNRVATVKKALVNKGVDASLLETAIDNDNLTTFGPKYASLDRAVTIEIK